MLIFTFRIVSSNKKRNGRLRRPFRRLGNGRQLSMVAKLGELGDQAPGLVFGGTAIEGAGSEAVMCDAIFQDMIDRREQRGGRSEA